MLKIKVPASLQTLHQVQAQVVEQLPPEFQSLCSKLELVLEEVLVNVFYYAYKEKEQDGDAEIIFCAKEYDGQHCAYLSVRDWGPQFNPFTDVAAPNIDLDAEHRPIGGLGIFFVKTLATHYKYTFESGSNYIELYFAPELNKASR